MPTFFKPIPLYYLVFLPFPLSETVEEPFFEKSHQSHLTFDTLSYMEIPSILPHLVRFRFPNARTRRRERDNPVGQLSEVINLKQRISYRADKRPVLPVQIAGPSPQALFKLRKNYGKRLPSGVF